MIRDTLLFDLLAQLQTITVANGYLTNIGQDVKYWDIYPADYNGGDSVTYRDEQENVQKVNLTYNYTLQLQVEAVAYCSDVDKLSKSNNLLADLKFALFDTIWSNAYFVCRQTENQKDIGGQGKQFVFLTVFFDVEYREK